MAIERICNFPCCQKFALEGHLFCKEHYKEPEAFKNAIRNNAGLYNTVHWRRFREKHLKNNPYCINCGTTENLTVDHIIDPLGNLILFFNKDNLQTLCKECHRVKTAKEIADRRKNKH
jgi:probable phage phi-105 holin-like protein